MLGLDLVFATPAQREEDEFQFLRNLHFLAHTHNGSGSATSKQNNKSSHKMLQEFVHELSFWNSHGCDSSGKSKHSSRKQKSTQSTSRDVSHAAAPAVWKSAVDPATGRTYYYDAITRQTQWHKPPELRAMEKQRKLEQRLRDMEFFREMERNILASLKRGELVPGTALHAITTAGPPREPKSPPSQPPSAITANKARIRTISGMDEILLQELQRDPMVAATSSRPTGSSRRTILSAKGPPKGRPPLPARVTTPPPQAGDADEYDSDPMELSPDLAHKELLLGQDGDNNDHPLYRTSNNSISHSDFDDLAGESLLDDPLLPSDIHPAPQQQPQHPQRPPTITQHSRRNTGGTIYLQNTLYNPDIAATIKGVCGVYRAHIVQAAAEANKSPVSVGVLNKVSHVRGVDPKIFLDQQLQQPCSPSNTRTGRKAAAAAAATLGKIPSLAEIESFYLEFYRRSQMEQDTILMSLIYVERLIKTTPIVPTPDNWRSILFSCMVLASKVWDDLSMWNVDFSNVSAASTAGLTQFTLSRINQLELALLQSLEFQVRVTASEYAKYYFLIRSMLLRSGLVQEATAPLQRSKSKPVEGPQATASAAAETTTNTTSGTSSSKTTSAATTTTSTDTTLAVPKMATTTTSQNQTTSKPPPPSSSTTRNRVQSLDGILKWLESSKESGVGPVLRDTVCLEQLLVAN